MHKYYFQSPVAAVQVTRDNLEEVAAWAGGFVSQASPKSGSSKRVPCVEFGTDVLRQGSRNNVAFPGSYVTKKITVGRGGVASVSVGIFTRAYFEANHDEDPGVVIDKTWDLAPDEGNIPPGATVLSE